VVAVWENYNATETAIRNEAKAVGDMAQLSCALAEISRCGNAARAGCLCQRSAAIGMGHDGQRLPSKTTADALAHLNQAIIDMQVGQTIPFAVRCANVVDSTPSLVRPYGAYLVTNLRVIGELLYGLFGTRPRPRVANLADLTLCRHRHHLLAKSEAGRVLYVLQLGAFMRGMGSFHSR